MEEFGSIPDDSVLRDKQGRAYRLERVWISSTDGSYPDIERVYLEEATT